MVSCMINDHVCSHVYSLIYIFWYLGINLKINFYLTLCLFLILYINGQNNLQYLIKYQQCKSRYYKTESYSYIKSSKTTSSLSGQI